MIHSRRILPFTLVELLIVMAIVTLVAGGLGVSVFRIIQKERFHAGVEIVVNKLRVAQEIMLIHNSSVNVVFKSYDGKITCYMTTEAILRPDALERALTKSIELKGIKFISFEKTEGSIEESDIKLEFQSGGSKMSRGQLILSSQSQAPFSDDNTSYINLPGQPTLIKTGKEEEETADEAEIEQLYPREVLED